MFLASIFLSRLAFWPRSQPLLLPLSPFLSPIFPYQHALYNLAMGSRALIGAVEPCFIYFLHQDAFCSLQERNSRFVIIFMLHGISNKQISFDDTSCLFVIRQVRVVSPICLPTACLAVTMRGSRIGNRSVRQVAACECNSGLVHSREKN